VDSPLGARFCQIEKAGLLDILKIVALVEKGGFMREGGDETFWTQDGVRRDLLIKPQGVT